MIIVIGSRKGGTGKSTIATNIACALSQNSSVMLIDADRQPSSSSWSEERDSRTDVSSVFCMQKYGQLQKHLIELHKHYSHIIVDCSGRDSIEFRSALTSADILIVPVRPSRVDWETLGYTSQLIEEIKLVNPNMRPYVLLTQAPTNPKIDAINTAKMVFNDYPILTPVNQIIHDRQVYRDALAEGLGVIETDNDKAADEIRGLIEEVFNG